MPPTESSDRMPDVNRLPRMPGTFMRCSSMKTSRHSRIRSGASSRTVLTPISLLVIPTPSHKAGILEYLDGAACNPEKRMEQGDLLVLDAAELFSLFMVGGMLEVGWFESAMTRIMNFLADRGVSVA